MPTSRLLRLLTTAAFVATAAPALAAATDSGLPVASPLPRAQSLSGAYLAAKAAQLDGDLSTSADFYAQALALDPSSQQLRQDALFAYLADGRFAKAVDLATGLQKSPEAAKVARITLGVDSLDKGEYDRAIKQFDIADQSDLDALLLGELMAWAELGAGRADQALARIDELHGAPWYPVFNDYQKGLLATVADRPQVAREALSKVVDDPTTAQTSPDAFLSAADALGRLEAREGNKDAALAAVNKGLDILSSFDPLILLKKRIERGETIEPSVANVREGAAETLYVLGQAINRGDGQQVALLYFQLARALAPQNPPVLAALAGLAERAQRLDQAIEIYKDIPANSAYRRTADLQIGLDLWYSDKKKEAKEHLERALRDYPKDIQAYTAFSDVLAADKDYERAAQVLDQAIGHAKQQDAETWNLYYQRGIAYERTKHWDKAEADFKQALKMSPNQPQVLNYLGYSWVDMNQHLEEGLQMIKTAVELRPNDGYIIDSLGWAYYRLGRYQDSVDQLERAVLITPMDPTINDHLGDAYWQVGRHREARFQWKRALIGDPKPDAETIQAINAKLEHGLTPSAGKPDDKSDAANGPGTADKTATVAPAATTHPAPGAKDAGSTTRPD